MHSNCAWRVELGQSTCKMFIITSLLSKSWLPCSTSPNQPLVGVSEADKSSWISRVACPRSCPRLKAPHQISEGLALEYGLELASCMYAFFFCTSSLPFTVTRGYVG